MPPPSRPTEQPFHPSRLIGLALITIACSQTVIADPVVAAEPKPRLRLGEDLGVVFGQLERSLAGWSDVFAQAAGGGGPASTQTPTPAPQRTDAPVANNNNNANSGGDGWGARFRPQRPVSSQAENGSGFFIGVRTPQQPIPTLDRPAENVPPPMVPPSSAAEAGGAVAWGNVFPSPTAVILSPADSSDTPTNESPVSDPETPTTDPYLEAEIAASAAASFNAACTVPFDLPDDNNVYLSGDTVPISWRFPSYKANTAAEEVPGNLFFLSLEHPGGPNTASSDPTLPTTSFTIAAPLVPNNLLLTLPRTWPGSPSYRLRTAYYTGWRPTNPSQSPSLLLITSPQPAAPSAPTALGGTLCSLRSRNVSVAAPSTAFTLDGGASPRKKVTPLACWTSDWYGADVPVEGTGAGGEGWNGGVGGRKSWVRWRSEGYKAAYDFDGDACMAAQLRATNAWVLAKAYLADCRAASDAVLGANNALSRNATALIPSSAGRLYRQVQCCTTNYCNDPGASLTMPCLPATTPPPAPPVILALPSDGSAASPLGNIVPNALPTDGSRPTTAPPRPSTSPAGSGGMTGGNSTRTSGGARLSVGLGVVGVEMARRRAKRRGPSSHSSTATAPAPSPSSPASHPSKVAYLTSLPPELARRIVPLLHPRALANLIRTSSSARRLYRPADTELEFAVKHLLLQFPLLREIAEQDGAGSFSSEFEYEDYGSSTNLQDRETAYRQLRDEVPFRQLPLCYALAALKVDDFRRISFQTITGVHVGDENQEFSWTRAQPQTLEMTAWLKQLLLLGVAKTELAFNLKLTVWNGNHYELRGACEWVQKYAALLNSVEAARRITDIEKNSVQMLPSGQRRLNILKFHGEPEKFLSMSFKRFAFTACESGAVAVLQFLLETHPARFVNMAEHRSESLLNETYLQLAFRNRHKDMFKMLVEFLKRPPYCGTTTSGQPSPVNGDVDVPFLSLASFVNDVAMVRLLLECGADPNFRARDFYTRPSRYIDALSSTRFERPLHLACCEKNLNIIHLLVAHGANPLARVDYRNFTALMACLSAEAASALLEAVKRHAPHEMHDLFMAECSNKFTALHWAVLTKKTELVRVLLEAIEKEDGDDGLKLKRGVFSAQGKFKDTVLFRACSLENHEDIGMMVLGAMFDGVDQITFNEMRNVLLMDDGYRRTPVHAAVENGQTVSLRKMMDVLSSFDDGMRQKVVGMKNRLKLRTPLHVAAWKGRLACAQILLEHGADPKEKDINGLTPLMIAEREKHKSVAKFLLTVMPSASQERSTGGRYELRSQESMSRKLRD
ncbi:hypothetical protein HDU96_003735 [Phlyctochytrium bullatum]|nr:hypothetical protein HDU96_003735 [Phlyctochytrium bullatum]